MAKKGIVTWVVKWADAMKREPSVVTGAVNDPIAVSFAHVDHHNLGVGPNGELHLFFVFSLLSTNFPF